MMDHPGRRTKRRLKNLDRTQSRLAATRKFLIEGRESARIAGHRRHVQGVSDVDAVCNCRKHPLDALCVFNLHSRQPHCSLDRPGDGNIVKVVHRTEHPECLEQDSLPYPNLLRLEGGARTSALCLVIVDQKPYEHVRINGNHAVESRLRMPRILAADLASNASVKIG